MAIDRPIGEILGILDNWARREGEEAARFTIW